MWNLVGGCSWWCRDKNEHQILVGGRFSWGLCDMNWMQILVAPQILTRISIDQIDSKYCWLVIGQTSHVRNCRHEKFPGESSLGFTEFSHRDVHASLFLSVCQEENVSSWFFTHSTMFSSLIVLYNY